MNCSIRSRLSFNPLAPKPRNRCVTPVASYARTSSATCSSGPKCMHKHKKGV